jgi:5-formyltetrahydrofolate cyclo-ligase
MASEDLPANGHGGPADPKTALRRHLRAVRRDHVARLTADERAADEAALAAVLAAKLPRGIVAGYHAAGSEIGLSRVAGVTLFPRVVPGAPLSFHSGPATATLSVTGLSTIAEPPATAPRSTPGVVLVPLLGVDRSGTRLGQGGGHYDRTLAALRAAGPVLAVGVAWDCQRVDALPADPWDAPLDALATPSGWYDFRR